MKKLIVLLVISLVMIVSTGCNNKEVEKNMFIEKVKSLEINEIKFETTEITYDEFKENISDLFSQEAEKDYLEKKDLEAHDDLNSLYNDFEIITEEELKKDVKRKEENTEKIELTLEISDANYEGTFDGEKRVYSKKTRAIHSADRRTVKQLFFTMYDFKKVNDDWRITQIKSSTVRLDTGIYDRETEKTRKLTAKEIEEILTFTAFTPENNNKIEYVEKINIILLLQ